MRTSKRWELSRAQGWGGQHTKAASEGHISISTAAQFGVRTTFPAAAPSWRDSKIYHFTVGQQPNLAQIQSNERFLLQEKGQMSVLLPCPLASAFLRRMEDSFSPKGTIWFDTYSVQESSSRFFEAEVFPPTTQKLPSMPAGALSLLDPLDLSGNPESWALGKTRPRSLGNSNNDWLTLKFIDYCRIYQNYSNGSYYTYNMHRRVCVCLYNLI